MLRFYWSLLREMPAAFRGAAEAWGFWVWTIGASALVLLNPSLDRWINAPQFSRRFVFVPVAVSVAYVMLRANYQRVLSVSAERDHARARVRQLEARPPITRAEWMEMAGLFEKLQNTPVQADWNKSPEQEFWLLTAIIGHAVPHVDTLCRRAGEMLLASPRVATKLSDRVRAQESPLYRWLQFVGEQPIATMVIVDISASADGVPIPVEGGYIANVPLASAHVCVQCSADEI
jgi:hypothetical protein